jgi:cytochrome c oxidase cbb3-type subunit II
MNSGPLIFLGVFFALASSFWGLVVVPQMQIGQQAEVKIETTGALYPQNRPGQASQGAELYRSLGCVECHTQQVRPRGQGADFDRGWGQRRSVAQDYLRDYPAMIGSQRVGADLANVGARLPDADYQFRHLYNPRLVMPGSMMPPHPFLFEKRQLAPGQPPAADALKLDRATGYEVVPKQDAKLLVAYLLSLRSDTPLFEAPLPLPPPTNAPAADATATNVPAAATTNAAATTTNK